MVLEKFSYKFLCGHKTGNNSSTARICSDNMGKFSKPIYRSINNLYSQLTYPSKLADCIWLTMLLHANNNQYLLD